MGRRLRPLRDDHDGDDRPARDGDAEGVQRPVRLWLTELGYQSNPPDRLLGVSPALQASYIAACRLQAAWATPRVDLLIQYLYRDEPGLGPLAERSRDRGRQRQAGDGRRRGPARPGEPDGLDDTRLGSRPPRVAASARTACSGERHAGWTAVGGSERTRADGTIQRKVQASRGTQLRLLASGDPGNTLVVR